MHDDFSEQEPALNYPFKLEALIEEITKTLGAPSKDELKIITSAFKSGMSTEEIKSKVRDDRKNKEAALEREYHENHYDDSPSGP